MTACATSSRSVGRESADRRTAQWRVAQARDSVVTELRDTLREVTKVTVQLDAAGDTLRMSTVTDITRARASASRRLSEERETTRTDTVYVAVHESVQTSRSGSGAGRTWLRCLLGSMTVWLTSWTIFIVKLKKNRRTERWQK